MDALQHIEVDGVTRPRFNSDGHLIHHSDAGIQNFWRWFGDSQTVDHLGRPVVLYHGTQRSADFESFDGAAIYFAEPPSYASNWAAVVDSVTGVATNARLIPVYLKARKPVNMTAGLDTFNPQSDPQVMFYDLRDEDSGELLHSAADAIDSIKRQGLDAVFWHEGQGHRNWVVFDASQVKSAVGNSGRFDPDSASLCDGHGAETVDQTDDEVDLGADQAGLWPWNPLPADRRAQARVGQWIEEDVPDLRGTPVVQLREVEISTLLLPELDERGHLQPEKRAYVDAYQARLLAGEEPPPIYIVEMEGGRLRVVDGHRRTIAASRIGRNSMVGTVSPVVEHEGCKVTLTKELAALYRDRDWPQAKGGDAVGFDLPVAPGGDRTESRLLPLLASQQVAGALRQFDDACADDPNTLAAPVPRG